MNNSGRASRNHSIFMRSLSSKIRSLVWESRSVICQWVRWQCNSGKPRLTNRMYKILMCEPTWWFTVKHINRSKSFVNCFLSKWKFTWKGHYYQSFHRVWRNRWMTSLAGLIKLWFFRSGTDLPKALDIQAGWPGDCLWSFSPALFLCSSSYVNCLIIVFPISSKLLVTYLLDY